MCACVCASMLGILVDNSKCSTTASVVLIAVAVIVVVVDDGVAVLVIPRKRLQSGHMQRIEVR